MKLYLLTPLFLMVGISACQEIEENTDPFSIDYPLTGVTSVSPENGLVVDLDNTPSVMFSWQSASWGGIGFPVYDIVFDKEESDFSSPILICHCPSPEDTCHDFSVLDLKSVFKKSITSKSQSVINLKWAIRTTAGGKRVLSSARSICLKMLPEPDEFVAGNDVFIAGSGAVEVGRKMSYIPSQPFDPGRYYDRCTSGGNVAACTMSGYDYEIFTKLEGGKPFYFWTGTSSGDKDWIWVTDTNNGNSFVSTVKKDADTTSTVPVSGLYRIRFNSSTGEALVSSITSVVLRRFSGNANATMTYDGDGRWKVTNYHVTWGDKVAADAVHAYRIGYKFLMTVADAYGTSYSAIEQHYGYSSGKVKEANLYGIQPGDDGKGLEHYYVEPVAVGPFADLFGWPEDMILPVADRKVYTPTTNLAACPNPYYVDCTLFLNSEKGHYTHEFSNIIKK